MKREQGKVLSTEGTQALIQVGRHAECVHCGACAGNRQQVIEAENAIGAQPGQRVEFSFYEAGILQSAFIVFLFPLLFSALGACLGWWLGGCFWGTAERGAFAGVMFFFAVSLLVVKLFDHYVAEHQTMKPAILRILEEKSSYK